MATLMTIVSWSTSTCAPMAERCDTDWIEGVRVGLYVLFMNRLYADEFYQLLGQTVMRLITVR